MVIDQIKNAGLYYGIGERVKAALEYLQNTDFMSMEPGKYEIDGSNVYALVQQYQTKKRDQSKWEAHRKYIDIQYVAEGAEMMGYANLGQMKQSTDYNSEKDVLFFEGDGEFFTMKAGTFMILAPEDIHMPGQEIGVSAPVRKVVMKVLID